MSTITESYISIHLLIKEVPFFRDAADTSKFVFSKEYPTTVETILLEGAKAAGSLSSLEIKYSGLLITGLFEDNVLMR